MFRKDLGKNWHDHIYEGEVDNSFSPVDESLDNVESRDEESNVNSDVEGSSKSYES